MGEKDPKSQENIEELKKRAVAEGKILPEQDRKPEPPKQPETILPAPSAEPKPEIKKVEKAAKAEKEKPKEIILGVPNKVLDNLESILIVGRNQNYEITDDPSEPKSAYLWAKMLGLVNAQKFINIVDKLFVDKTRPFFRKVGFKDGNKKEAEGYIFTGRDQFLKLMKDNLGK